MNNLEKLSLKGALGFLSEKDLMNMLGGSDGWPYSGYKWYCWCINHVGDWYCWKDDKNDCGGDTSCRNGWDCKEQ